MNLAGARIGVALLRRRQVRRIEQLPDDHRVVPGRHGTAAVCRSDRESLPAQPDGRLVGTTPKTTERFG